MKAEGEPGKLFTFIHYQRYMGLNDIEYSHIQKGYKLKVSWSSYGIQLLTHVIFIVSLVEAMSEEGVAYVDMMSTMGNLFHQLLILSMPITQILFNGWSRFQQASQQHLLQTLTKIATCFEVDTLTLPRPRRLYRLWVGVCIFYAIIIVTFLFNHIFWKRNQISSFLAFLSYFILTVRSNFIVTCYTSLVHVSLVLLKGQQDQLDCILKSRLISTEELSQSLCLYDELLLLCQQEIVQVFGGSLIFLMIFNVLDAICTVYISALKNPSSVADVSQSIVWLLPICLYLCMPMIVNNLSVQLVIRGLAPVIYSYTITYKMRLLEK